jgi:hypothetical protein
MTFKRVSAEGQGEIWSDLAQGVMVNSRGGLLRRQFAVRVVTAHEGRPVARRPVIDARTQGPGEIDEEALYGDPPHPGAQRPVKVYVQWSGLGETSTGILRTRI